VAALAALAQDTRLDLFRLLVQRGPAGLPAGRVAERLDIPPATLSFHLAQLRHAGLLVSRREGRQIVYAADYARMSALLSYLTENCCRPGAPGCAGPPAVSAAKQRRSRRGTDRQPRHRT
jgi:DNA-binding transcriptional ArsR family regulator